MPPGAGTRMPGANGVPVPVASDALADSDGSAPEPASAAGRLAAGSESTLSLSASVSEGAASQVPVGSVRSSPAGPTVTGGGGMVLEVCCLLVHGCAGRVLPA